MIGPDDTQFPNNIVELCHTRFGFIDTDLTVLKRPVRASDPNQCVGVTAAQWMPNDESKQFLGQATAMQPPLSRYGVTVQAFIRDTDEVRGLNVHSVLSRMVRDMLYTDQPLRVALSQLSTTLNGMTEHTQRWGITQQRFFTNEIAGDWLYLSTLEFWLETEIR